MKLQYFQDTDTLYINLADRPSPESEALTDDVIVDFDTDGKVVGITIDNFSRNVDSTAIETDLNIPANTKWGVGCGGNMNRIPPELGDLGGKCLTPEWYEFLFRFNIDIAYL